MVAALTVSVASAWAGNPKEEESLRKMQFNLDKNGLAIEGYDPVAYFPEGGEKPAKGSPDYQATRLGVTYWFVNDENRQRFLADPEKYEPAYGGWCAYAMGAKGAKVEVDPKAYEVRDGHLFLFYRSILTDTRKPWGKNRDTLKPAADKNWEQVIHDPADKAKKGK
ncbi:MAG: YHS domain protein [Phycisphaerae bacterium]|nr:YHS domain protein [Phycisphaerae bacterium]